MQRMTAKKRKPKDYRIALRPFRDLRERDGEKHSPDDLDDIVVQDVSMFRAEMMDKGVLWMCCYLPGCTDPQERITFWVRAKRGRLTIVCTEQPSQSEVTYEPQPEQLP